MSDLADRRCPSTSPDTPPVEGPERDALLARLDGWTLVDGKLTRSWAFPDFLTGLHFVNRLGGLAEAEGHHPDITLVWGRVTVTLWTHDIGGLSEADFILAAKADRLR